MPVIGKVLNVTEHEFDIHYWKGSFIGKWSPQNAPGRRTPYVNTLPKTCVILCDFSLSDDNELLPSTRQYLKDEYARLKNPA